MLLGTAFLMLVSLVLNTVMAATLESMHQLFAAQAFFWTALGTMVSVAMATVVFSLIFAFVPDTKLGWRDVWVGGIVTAILFTLGQELLGFYLGDASRLSVYGAFASLIVFLLWVYYSAQILLLGAEFTNVYSRHRRARRTTVKSN
jgi:membrane protein